MCPKAKPNILVRLTEMDIVEMVLVDAFDKSETEKKKALWIIARGMAESGYKTKQEGKAEGEPEVKVDEEAEKLLRIEGALRDLAKHVRSFGLKKARILYLDTDEPWLGGMFK